MKSKNKSKPGGIALFFQKIGYAFKVIFRKLGGFIKKHKILSVLIGLVLVVGLALTIMSAIAANNMPRVNGDMMSYVRTVTLSKSDLLDTVTVTGTVESANVSSVESTVAGGTVKEILVQVGDVVQEGDVILTLDTAELLKQISKEQTNLSTTISNAQDAYDRAVSTRDKAATAKNNAYNAYAAAQSALNAVTGPYNVAKNAVAPEQAAYDTAVNDPLTGQVKAQNDLSAAAVAFEAKLAVCPYHHTMSDTTTGGTDCGCDTAKGIWTAAQTALDTANTNVANKKQALDTAKTLANYTAAEAAYSTASASYTKAQAEYDAAVNSLESAESSVTSAYKSLQTSKSGDKLTELKETLEKYTLKAKSSGTVTYLNATVGGTCTGTVATIQDTNDLKISVSVAEYDIKSVQVGMRCIITSDATTGEIKGVVTSINPTTSAGMSGGGSNGGGGGSATGTSSTFDAEIAVEGGANGLLIGVNASVDVVLSSIDNVFSVPIDAVGADAQGNKVVYLQSGSEAGRPVFTEVIVKLGEQTDYLVEISAASLKAGDIIRASANPDEASVDTGEALPETITQQGGFSFGMGGSGARPSGTGGQG